jgi:hypothetical protein
MSNSDLSGIALIQAQRLVASKHLLRESPTNIAIPMSHWRLAAEATHQLKGWIALECGKHQSEAASNLLGVSSFDLGEIVKQHLIWRKARHSESEIAKTSILTSHSCGHMEARPLQC